MSISKFPSTSLALKPEASSWSVPRKINGTAECEKGTNDSGRGLQSVRLRRQTINFETRKKYPDFISKGFQFWIWNKYQNCRRRSLVALIM